jgi:transcriptional regulator with XRE-family HTH domain
MGFSQTIRTQLRAREWSVKRFADEIGRGPEHARKLRNGTAFPSGDLAQRIAVKLGLDPAEFQAEVDVAKWEKKHGRKPPQTAHPELGPIEHLWIELSADQREYLLCVANCLLSQRIP